MLESEQPHAAVLYSSWFNKKYAMEELLCWWGVLPPLRGLLTCLGYAVCPCRKSSHTLINLGPHMCSGSEPTCFDPTSDKPHVLSFVTRRTSWECSLHLWKTYHQQEHYLQPVAGTRPDKSDKNADFCQHHLHLISVSIISILSPPWARRTQPTGYWKIAGAQAKWQLLVLS